MCLLGEEGAFEQDQSRVAVTRAVQRVYYGAGLRNGGVGAVAAEQRGDFAQFLLSTR